MTILLKATLTLKMLRSVYLVLAEGWLKKIKQFNVANVSRFAPDVAILEIGTNDLCNAPPETVGSQIDELVELSCLLG